MPIQPPSRQELAQVASAFALHLTEEEIDAFYELAEPTAAGYARLDELEDETLPVKYPRAETGYRPTGEENPSNGWSWRCSIPGAPEGPLAGRTVGIKDNVCVAGVPMLNPNATRHSRSGSGAIPHVRAASSSSATMAGVSRTSSWIEKDSPNRW